MVPTFSCVSPKDGTLFEDAVQPFPGIYCANPVVTYLNL